ncbi:AEC family transporter [Labrenzia sp. DG1229]|uniref:AEC family transporter n=1 Tax=Labrenzia sp. DG1229 TaxID=681847 RepID=UPI00048F797D|nr:AEC family transporter [Labrenzia sp. DG1229]
MLAQTLSIVAPVFLLIGIGYCLARFQVLDQPIGDALGQFVFIVALPVLVFRSLINADLSGGFPLSLWASYFLGVGTAWTLGTLVIRKGFGREARAGAIGGISASYANLLLVGMPVVSTVYGDKGLIPVLLIISIHLATMTVVMAIAMERTAAIDSGKASPPIGRLCLDAGRKVITNPLIVTIILAFAWRQTGLSIPDIGEDILGRIAATALPLALLSLGMSLVQYGLRGNVLPGFLLGTIKIFVMPAVVFLAGTFLFQLPPLWIAAATLAAGCPTGVNAYIFANRYGTGHAMSANAITMTTLSAIVTTSLWIWFLGLWFGQELG